MKKEERAVWIDGIPHTTFEVMEDNEHYCHGFVFSIADLYPLPTSAAMRSVEPILGWTPDFSRVK